MTITLNADYDVTLNIALLGYVGETNARPVSVEGMEIDGADRYVLTIDYGDGVQYEVDITGGQWTPTADILRSAQTVSCQICAKKLSGQEYILLKKSRIFRLRIGAAIGDTAIPSPDVALTALDRIDAIGRQAHADMQTAVTAAETASKNADSIGKEKIAIDEAKTDIDAKYAEISYTATRLDTEYNNLTSNYYTKKIVDSTFATKTEINNTNTEVSELKEDLAELGNKILHEEYADLLHGKEPKENWYIDASNGSGKTLKQFFSFTNIDVSNYIGQRIYPYTSIGKDGILHSSRSVVFYDKNGSYIEGHGVSSNAPILGIKVSNGAKTVSVCFNYDSDDNQPIKPQVYYLATNRENKNKLMLKSDVLIDYEQIQNKPIIPTKMSELENDIVITSENDVQTIRKPTFSFIFDDGTSGDINAKALFDEYGFKCGFAIVANSNLSNIKDRYLEFQKDGFEILSHSVDGTQMQTMDAETANKKMKDSLNILKSNGFDIKGFVTPSSWLNADCITPLKKYYEYGFGHLIGNPEGVFNHNFFGLDIRQLDRWSLQSKTIDQTMEKIQFNITNNAYMIFYGHSYPQTSDNMTVENMKTILDFLKEKVDSGEIIVDTPRNAINNYYFIRHSDLLEMYSKSN